MQGISTDTLANLRFRLLWQDHGVCHEDCLVAERFNLWRDMCPPALREAIRGRRPGERCCLPAGNLLGDWDACKVWTLPRKAFRPATPTELFRGRFLPQGAFRGIPGVFPQNMRPCRVLECHEDTVVVDANHPLAGVEASLDVEVLDVWPKESEFGGSCQDWLERVADGPGLKRGLAGGVCFPEEPYTRKSPQSEQEFYAQPRMVGHVDRQAAARITALYRELLGGSPRVLDLMAGWESHLPEGIRATGLGMNAEEMAANPALDQSVVHDLNAQPWLPFADGAFDAVVCALSIEYLRRPETVLRDVWRVLVPGGLVVVVVSHRWFPGWAMDVWTELHEFERVGLMVHWLQRAGFDSIATRSDRGWPRPADARDRYFPRIQHADPIHGVWARRPEEGV